MFMSEVVKSAKRPHMLHESKGRKHGHCRVKTRQLPFQKFDYLVDVNITTTRNVLTTDAQNLSLDRHNG
jgi:hypothetical protein